MSARGADVTPELAAAAEWRLLALLLSRPRPGWREELAALAPEVPDRQLRTAAGEAAEASEGAYHALLGAGGKASSRAAAHAGFQDPGRILADLAGRYGAFGFAPGTEEPADHLAVECDFVAFLFLKEAYARVRGQAEAAEVTREARARFLVEHVAIAGAQLAGKLPRDAPPYLARAAGSRAARLPEPPPPAPACEPGPDCDPLGGGCPAV